VPTGEHAEQQRRAVPDGKQRDVESDVLQPIQEEDDPGQEQQMVVPRDHVLRAEVHVRSDVRTRRAEQELLILAGDAVSVRNPAAEQDGKGCQCSADVPHARARHTLLLQPLRCG
jgi:hypothetical protein